MNKNIIYVIVLALLAGIAYFFISKDDSTSSNVDSKLFSIEDTASIGKIFIADRSGKNNTLERKNGTWELNGKYEARREVVKLLLSTLKRMKIDYPVGQAAKDNVMKKMKTLSIKVEIYDKEGNEIKVFHVGDETPSNKGTNMVLDGSSQPYVVSLPAFEGFLNGRFFTKEEEWRSREVFGRDQKEIKSVKVDYKYFADQSFKIDIEEEGINLTALNRNVTSSGEEIFDAQIMRYIDGYRFLHAEAFNNRIAQKDSIIGYTEPFCKIYLETFSGDIDSVKFYYRPVNKRTKGEMFSKDVGAYIESDKYLALINEDEDLMLVQHLVFGKIFKGYSDFLKKKDI